MNARRRIAAALVAQLERDGIRAVVANSPAPDFPIHDERDLDLFVSHDVVLCAESATRLEASGIFVTSVWPSDVDTMNVILRDVNDSSALQVDMVCSPNGDVGYGYITPKMVEASRDLGEPWRYLSEVDALVYVMTKRLVKGQWDRFDAIVQSPEFLRLGPYVVAGRAREVLEPRTAAALRRVLGGERRFRSDLHWISRTLPGARRDPRYVAMTLMRYARRLRHPVGVIVELPSKAAGMDSVHRSLDGAAHTVEWLSLFQVARRFSVGVRFRSYIGVMQRRVPSCLLPYWQPDLVFCTADPPSILAELNAHSARVLRRYRRDRPTKARRAEGTILHRLKKVSTALRSGCRMGDGVSILEGHTEGVSMQLSEYRAAAVIKRITPALSNLVLASPVTRRTVRLLEIYLSILQGRGAATAWSRDGEAAAVASVIPAPRPTIIDVGAAVGDWARLTSSRLARPGVFYLVEPSQVNWPKLDALSLNGEVHVVRAACSIVPGEAELKSNFPGSGSASLYVRRDSFHTDASAVTQKVAVTTVAEVARRYMIDEIDFLKVDVEGAEMDVLLGAMELLEQGRIKALSFEFGSGQVNSRSYFRDFWDLLTNLGFRLYCIAPGGKLLSIPIYDEEHEHYRGVSNYLAVLS
jgi:FkbM family methyltransferase